MILVRTIFARVNGWSVFVDNRTGAYGCIATHPRTRRVIGVTGLATEDEAMKWANDHGWEGAREIDP
ncbi:hypothetical protein [Falsiroseomonas sp. CW058]|uniref:hypothetical protein n=1 Tax=Falsiroseomonas sp. CW058 TaxID=3388664 RepID=UPI003D31C845